LLKDKIEKKYQLNKKIKKKIESTWVNLSNS